MSMASDPVQTEKLLGRIRGLRAKTLANGCTEAEAMLAATKVADLLALYDLSAADVAEPVARCEQRGFAAGRKKRIPLDACIGAIAAFCDCRVWRERPDGKGADKDVRYVFFGLPADVEAAVYLAELVDHAVRSELGAFKISAAYRGFHYDERHLANASFALGMVGSIGDKLAAMKAARATVGGGRDLVVLKRSVVDAELAGLDLRLREGSGGGRMISPEAYEAGEAAGAGLSILPDLPEG